MLISVDKSKVHVESDDVTFTMKDDGSIIVKKGGVEIVDREDKRRELSILNEKCQSLQEFWSILTFSKIDKIFSEIL